MIKIHDKKGKLVRVELSKLEKWELCKDNLARLRKQKDTT